MLFDEDQYKLQGELYDVNQRIADQANTLQDHFLSKSGRETLSQIWSVFLPRQIEDQIPLESAAKAFISILDLHPALQGPPISRVGRPLFPDQPGYLPSASEEAGKILLFGSIYLGISGQIDGPYFDKLWEIIAGADIVNTLLRNVLTGKPFNPDPLPIPEKLPKQLVDFIRDFESRFCLAGVRDAYIGFGAAQQAWNPSSNAKGITSLDPTSGCAGQSVTIRGVGFGASRPQGREVYFPSRDGGCIPAKILPHGWTDTAIEVEVPTDVGTGCVGFVENGKGGATTLAQAASTLVGEVETCLGPLAAEPIRAHFEGRVAPMIACPPCLPGDVNLFIGGPPVILSFTGERSYNPSNNRAGDLSTVIDLTSGDLLTLHWSIENALDVQITPIAVNGQLNELPTLSSVFSPAHGDLLVSWANNIYLAHGTFAWIAAYQLRASNSCDSVEATVTIRMNGDFQPYASSSTFLWGVATAGRQVEGGLSNDDWEIFTTDPDILKRLRELKTQTPYAPSINPEEAGDALNHWSLLEFIRSVERSQALGLNAYRLSIEWSRIEPMRGKFDSAALANYIAMIDVLRARHMEPVVVLNHLSLPAWVSTPPRKWVYVIAHTGSADASDPDYSSKLKGWETTDTVDAYVNYVKYVVTQLLSHGVNYWITFNEPLATTVLTGYLASVFPPGFLGDGSRGEAAIHNLVTAHARAYEAIHAIQRTAQVGITDQWLFCKTSLGKDAARYFIYYHQDYLINALVHGIDDLYRIFRDDGNYTKPPAKRVLGVAEADWTPHLDFFGLQYYKSVYPYNFIPLANAASWAGAKVDLDLSVATVNYAHLQLNDMGWEICPEGLYESIMKLKKIAQFDGRDIPILVAENGTAEIVDHNRSAFVTAHLEQLQQARKDGANVIGYLHWSIADNWEWIDGYRKEAKFGLFSVDRSSGMNEYSITDGALALSYAVEHPQTTVGAAVSRFGRYRPDGALVEHPIMSPHATYQGTLDGDAITLLLASPPMVPTTMPAPYKDLTGLLFYGKIRRWIRLSDVVWDEATRTLQFSHPAISTAPQVPERIFAGRLDSSGQNVNGIASDMKGNRIVPSNWQLSRVPFAGMWQVQFNSGAKITLSLSCAEGVWHGRVLRTLDWSLLASIAVNATGFTAIESGAIVTAVLGLSSLIVSPWGVSLQRLPDGVPF